MHYRFNCHLFSPVPGSWRPILSLRKLEIETNFRADQPWHHVLMSLQSKRNKPTQQGLWKLVGILAVLLTCTVRVALAAQCGRSPAKMVNLDLWSTRSLSSPSRLWKFISIGSSSSEQQAVLFIQNIHTAQKWSVGSIERSGTAFWSGDSKRVFLQDRYAADDTRIRIFDVSGAEPREISGLDKAVRRAIFGRIPSNETTLWVSYPRACFAANDSSTIVLVADAPLVSKTESGPGKPFRLNITLNLNTLQIVK